MSQCVYCVGMYNVWVCIMCVWVCTMHVSSSSPSNYCMLLPWTADTRQGFFWTSIIASVSKPRSVPPPPSPHPSHVTPLHTCVGDDVSKATETPHPVDVHAAARQGQARKERSSTSTYLAELFWLLWLPVSHVLQAETAKANADHAYQIITEAARKEVNAPSLFPSQLSVSKIWGMDWEQPRTQALGVRGQIGHKSRVIHLPILSGGALQGAPHTDVSQQPSSVCGVSSLTLQANLRKLSQTETTARKSPHSSQLNELNIPLLCAHDRQYLQCVCKYIIDFICSGYVKKYIQCV